MTERKSRVFEEKDDFDLKKALAKFLDYWKLYVMGVIVSIILGLLFIRYSTPMYRAQAQLLVQDDQQSGASSLLGGNYTESFDDLFGVKNNVYNELGVLQTKDLLYEVVKEMNLNITYYRKGNVRSVELYKNCPFNIDLRSYSDTIRPAVINVTFTEKNSPTKCRISSDELNIRDTTVAIGDTIHIPFGVMAIKATGMPIEDAGYYFTTKPTAEVVQEMIDNLTMGITNNETTIINLLYNSNVPKKAEDVLNRLINVYMRRNITEKNKISDSSLAFINDRITIVAQELDQIETAIQNFKQKNKITDISEQAKVLIASSSDYYNKLNEVEVQLNVINSMLDIVNDESNNRPVPTTLNNDPTFLDLVVKYNSLLLEKDRLSLATTDQNPYVQNLDIQINSAKFNIKKSLTNQQKAFEISKDRLIAQNALINNTVQNIPLQERTYIGLSREQSVKQTLYLFLLQKKEETNITKASNISSASIIENPKSEYLPYFPQKLLIMALSLALGLLLPTAFVIMKHFLSNKIMTREDITDATNCNILAEIGHSENTSLLIKDEARSVRAEQFRVLRTNMDFLTGQKKCPVILITSFMSGEGKSFMAANLAQVFSFSGKRVLIMELDLRKPKLSAVFGLGTENGFSNFVISGKNIQQYMKEIPESPNVFLVSSGALPPNPAELIMSPIVDKLFEEQRENFDVIILDTPPIGAVADAQILSKHSDVNLYVVRQDYSHKGSIEFVNELMEREKLSHLYLILNDVTHGVSKRYGYGYGYSYGYGYGYADRRKKDWRSFFRSKK
jgi:capsular exopolysaccharide synthesis family protein